jgi:hypothetical protein
MTVKSRGIYETAPLLAAQTTLYTSNGIRTLIDKITVYATNVCTVTISLVPSGGVASSTTIMESKTFLVGEAYIWPGIVGHTLEPGDFVSVLSTAAPGGNIRITGREVT